MGLVTGSQCATRRSTANGHRCLAVDGRLLSIPPTPRKRYAMSSKTDVRLTPGQRLARGLKYTAVGPVDVTRGAVGLSVHGAQSAAGRMRRSIDKSRLAAELGE